MLACLWRAYGGERSAALHPEAVKLFFTAPPVPTGPLGFDTPGADPALRAAGRFFSPGSVGHLGFTGTSFWLDLDSGQMVVLLTEPGAPGPGRQDQNSRPSGPDSTRPRPGLWGVLRVESKIRMIASRGVPMKLLVQKNLILAFLVILLSPLGWRLKTCSRYPSPWKAMRTLIQSIFWT